MTDLRIVYSGNYIERFGEMRADRDALVDAFTDSSTRFVPVWQDRCLVSDGHPTMLRRDQVLPGVDDPEQAIFLGRLEDRFLFAVSVRSVNKPEFDTDAEFFGLRELTEMLTEYEAALLAYAKAMVSWQHRHSHCGVCGSANHSLNGGFSMECSDTACGHRSFPRLDPAVIVLIHHGERCLLGRQVQWPEGRFSTIAGFVEPGESLEDAIRREVREETNIAVGRCEYLASQPWPFPGSLMIGYHAEAMSQEICLNDGELAEARWLTRDDIAARAVVLPPDFSIAYRLIEAWFDLAGGPRLASLGLPNPPFLKRDTAQRH